MTSGIALDLKRRVLANEVISRHYDRSPDAMRRYGPDGQEKCVEDMLHTLLQVEAATSSDSVELLREYVAWLRTLFVRLDIAIDDLTGTLNALREVLAERGDAKAAGYVADALGFVANMPDAPASQLPTDNPLGAMADDYLNRVLGNDRRGATDLILTAAREGVPVRDLYLNLFQPCLREIGHLWQTNRITVAQEHYFTAATQMIMSQLYPYIFDRRSNGRRMVATCANRETHEIGMRMVADLFEMDGWETTYLGADTPIPGVLKLVREAKPEVLAISVTISPNVTHAAGLIAAVKTDPDCAAVRILVGGYCFNQSPDLWRRIGADGFARDAAAALAWAISEAGASVSAA